MKTIEIDEEVYAYLQSRAVAYVETPNLTLRRLFGLDKGGKKEAGTPRFTGRKKPKTDLSKLVRAGLIQEGQLLSLRDYQGRVINGCEAAVSRGALLWNGKRYSMSNLAKILLKQQGYESESVRGPSFWYTEDGTSIKNLWDQYLKTIQGT